MTCIKRTSRMDTYCNFIVILQYKSVYPHVAKMLTYSHSILSGPLVHEKDMVKIEMCTQRVHPHRPPHVKWGNGVFHDVVCVPPDAENSCKQPNYHYQWRICIGGYCCKRRLTSSVGGNMNVWCDENSYISVIFVPRFCKNVPGLKICSSLALPNDVSWKLLTIFYLINRQIT